MKQELKDIKLVVNPDFGFVTDNHIVFKYPEGWTGQRTIKEGVHPRHEGQEHIPYHPNHPIRFRLKLASNLPKDLPVHSLSNPVICKMRRGKSVYVYVHNWCYDNSVIIHDSGLVRNTATKAVEIRPKTINDITNIIEMYPYNAGTAKLRNKMRVVKAVEKYLGKVNKDLTFIWYMDVFDVRIVINETSEVFRFSKYQNDFQIIRDYIVSCQELQVQL